MNQVPQVGREEEDGAQRAEADQGDADGGGGRTNASKPSNFSQIPAADLALEWDALVKRWPKVGCTERFRSLRFSPRPLAVRRRTPTDQHPTTSVGLLLAAARRPAP